MLAASHLRCFSIEIKDLCVCVYTSQVAAWILRKGHRNLRDMHAWKDSLHLASMELPSWNFLQFGDVSLHGQANRSVRT